MLEAFAQYLVTLIYQFNYFGILIAMTIESTFIPLPSELILIPAGYLWYIGTLNPFLIILVSIIGAIIGSYFSYWLGEKLGRPFIEKHKKWFLLNDERLEKLDLFFNKYGFASIFLARLIVGVRHYISFPAGFAKMNKSKFILYTVLGSGLWSIVLMCLGYFIGTQMELIKAYLLYFTIVMVAIVCLGFLIIKIKNIRKKRKEKKELEKQLLKKKSKK